MQLWYIISSKLQSIWNEKDGFMKSNESFSTIDTTSIADNDYIYNETIKVLNEMKSILIDNSDFLKKLLAYVLHLGETFDGQHIYFQTIEEILFKEYPDLLKYEIGFEMRNNLSNLMHQLYVPNKEIVTTLIQQYLENQIIETEEALLGNIDENN
jgi:hypothetical protein